MLSFQIAWLLIIEVVDIIIFGYINIIQSDHEYESVNSKPNNINLYIDNNDNNDNDD